MKKRTVVIALMMSFLASPVFAKEIKVSVKGMVCGFCAQGISKKFKALPEIDDLKVSLEKKEVILLTKGDADLADQKINDLLKEAGFNVEKIERK